jgi:hypothetical protein
MAVVTPPPRIGKVPVAAVARKPPTKTRAKRKAKPVAVVIDKPGLINQ